MRITAADVIVTCPGRNYVTLKITTADGVTGLGDATLNGRELAVAAYLREHVCPLLIGRDAGHINDIWQYLYRGAYWRRGPVTMTSIAAVVLGGTSILGGLGSYAGTIPGAVLLVTISGLITVVNASAGWRSVLFGVLILGLLLLSGRDGARR